MLDLLYRSATAIAEGRKPRRHSRLTVLHWIVYRLQRR